MSRFLWLSLIFCVAISLIWWPGAKNEASIFELCGDFSYLVAGS